MEDVFNDIALEEIHFRRMQVSRYAHLYSATFNVPAAVGGVGSLLEAIFQVEEDADFYVTHICGCAQAPMNAAGTRNTGLAATYLAAGVSTGRSDRGLRFRLFDPGNGRTLQKIIVNARTATQPQDFIPFETVFPPGYSFEFAGGVAWEYYLERGRRLKLEMQNVDNGIHRVTFGFMGKRYAV